MRHHTVLQKRYCQITLFEALFVVCTFCWYPVAIIAESIFGDTSMKASLFWSLNNYFAYLLLYCFVWRFYMLYYDIKWMRNMINTQWKLVINPSYENEKCDDWFLKNKTKFGNYQWMKNKVFVISIISATITNIGGLWNSYNNSDEPITFYMIELITITLWFIPFILLTIIYCKMYQSKFEDNFHIMTEMRYIFITFCFHGITWNGYYVILIVIKPSIFVYEIVTFIVSFCIITAEFLAIIISTCYVLNKVKLIIDQHRYKTIHISYASTSNHIDSMRFVSLDDTQKTHELIQIIPPKIHSDTQQNWTLPSALSHFQAFQCFIQHLSREFSIECLLCLIEFIQFEQYILEHGDLVNIGIENMCCNDVIFPKDIPKSKIVDGEDIKDNDTLNRCHKICDKLYNKYLAINAEYEVNISSHLRQNFDVMMRNDVMFTVNALLQNIDECCQSQMSLMDSSFARFTSSAEYQKLKKFILVQK